MNNKKDLSRWNRAGLKGFRYIDGNAITYLETLRQTLNQQYNANSPSQWDELILRFPKLTNESLFQKTKRMSDQYYDQRRDYAWEILRSFSRSAHVLGEYINAYANEAYLPTAKEWDNVRKLVALLGYQPSPPSSAFTSIALLFKTGQSGEIKPGFAVKNKPANGESTIIFETQVKLNGNALINTLKLKDWNKNQQILSNKNNTIDFKLSQLAKDINIGDVGVLAAKKTGYPIEVSSIKNKTDYSILKLKLKQKNPKNKLKLKLFDTTLYLQPTFIAKPLANGVGSVTVDQKVNLATGDIVFNTKDNFAVARKISQVNLDKILFKQPQNSVGHTIIRAQVSQRQTIKNFPAANNNKDFFILNGIEDNTTTLIVDEKLNIIDEKIIQKQDNTNTRYIEGKDISGNRLFFTQKPTTAEALATIVKVGNKQVKSLWFTGKATDISSNQWAWVEHKKNQFAAYQVAEVKQEQDQFSLCLGNGSKGEKSFSSVEILHTGFKQALKHKEYEINTDTAWYTKTNTTTIFALEDSAVSHYLKRGQQLICSNGEKSIKLDIKRVQTDKNKLLLHVTPAIHLNAEFKPDIFNRNNTVLYGNVVTASHGEMQSQIILGNGDASQTNQQFKLSSDHISWITDARFNQGVRADIKLIVGDRYWLQVENLANSAAEDHHFQIKIDEENKLTVHFGDGHHGRKLPTGIDNIRANIRQGNGETGNLKPYSLVKISRPNALIADFIAPLAASGGANKESPEHMRENAPAALLTLNRAVSLSDFEHLARHHSQIWQAKAFEKVPDRPAPTLIEVVIVAAGGTTFANNTELALQLKSFFSLHAIPNQPISVVSYQPLVMQIKPTIMVDESAFDKQQVALAVKQHLQTSLSLKQRNLGQALFRSAIIGLIEQVEGVENANCEIIGAYLLATKKPSQSQTFNGVDGEIRKISILENQLLYLDTETFPLNIISQTFEI